MRSALDATAPRENGSSGLDVLHFDRHFERLGTLLGIRTPWLAGPAPGP